MKRTIGAASGLALVLTGSSARADGFTETAHEMALELHDTHATAVVRRTFATKYDVAIEAHVHLPAWGIATGLRTRGNDGRWYGAELLDVERAVDTYWRLTGSRKVVPDIVLPRGATTRADDPALLMWSPTGLDLYAFPVTDTTPRSVEYTLQIPYEYTDGAERLWIPTGDDEVLAPRIRVTEMLRGMVVRVDGTRVERGRELEALAADEIELVIERSRPPLALELAASPAGRRYTSRVVVRAGTELGPDPDRTHAVIVLDRSRSMGPDSMTAARTMLLAYLDRLAEVDDARVEIIGFDRRVQAEHGAFVTPAVARAALAKVELTLGNGSDLPGALAAAAKRLATAPRGAPRRAIVVSDATLAPRDEARIARSLASVGGVVHLVDVTGDHTTMLEPDREHRLLDVVEDTGGVVWTAKVDPNATEDGPVFDALVRPDRIHDFAVRVDGSLESLEGEGVWLEAGGGVLDVRLAASAPRRVTAEGSLWGKRVRVDAGRSAKADRTWARLAAAYISEEYSDAEILDVALRSGAVSPKTALLALEPGMKPSDEPATVPNDEPRVRVYRSACGWRSGSSGGFGRYSLEHDEADWMRTAVAEAAKACRAATYEVTLTTSYAEVLAIDAVRATDDADVACLTDALWNLEFPPGRPAVVVHHVASAGVGATAAR